MRHTTEMPMRLATATRLATAAALVTFVACAGRSVASHTTPDGQPALVWSPAPPVFAAGAQMAVLQGDPSKAEPFTARLRFPDGYRIALHTHPTDEHVTVIEGTFLVGMGEDVTPGDMLSLSAGGFVTTRAGQPHYFAARGTTVVQIHAVGPFALTYVHPSDLPVAARVSTR
jgi:quercetin dioxygenase-like cupin family protein